MRRNEILTAAYKLFVRHGYEATTVNALIDELGLSKGAFYHHFESKEEVMQALARRMAEEMYAKAGCRWWRAAISRRSTSSTSCSARGAQYKKAQLPMVRAMTEIYFAKRICACATAWSPSRSPSSARCSPRILDEGKRRRHRSPSTIPSRPRAS